MKSTLKNNDLRLTLSLVVLGVASYLLPHLPGFSAVGGISLFAGARLKGWKSYATPLLIMIASGSIRGAIGSPIPFDSVTPFVYGSFLITVWLGSHLRTIRSPCWIGGATLLGSCQFFVITNFGMWASGISFYPPTFQGLITCYVGALPYFGKTIASDLLYCAVLFGLYSYVTRISSAEAVSESTVTRP